jgi:hypothetical protein
VPGYSSTLDFASYSPSSSRAGQGSLTTPSVELLSDWRSTGSAVVACTLASFPTATTNKQPKPTLTIITANTAVPIVTERYTGQSTTTVGRVAASC